MSSSKVLSLTNDFKYYSKFKNIIILNDNFLDKKKNAKRKIEIFKIKVKNKKQLNKVYSYSEKIYHQLLSDLTKQLNIIHNLKKRLVRKILGDYSGMLVDRFYINFS